MTVLGQLLDRFGTIRSINYSILTFQLLKIPFNHHKIGPKVSDLTVQHEWLRGSSFKGYLIYIFTTLSITEVGRQGDVEW